MAIGIKTNSALLRSQTMFNRLERQTNTQREQAASGLRIVSGRDDAGRLYISEGMRAEIGGLTEGNRNTQKALDLLKTASGGMHEIHGVLRRMRKIATQSATSTLNNRNRESLDAEFTQLKASIDRTARAVGYNDQVLLSGFGNSVSATASTAVSASATTGVRNLKLSGANTGIYTFEDTNTDGSLTLGNGVTTQTIRLDTRLDGGQVATGTTLVANFDILGIQIELAGDQVNGGQGTYQTGDLDRHTVLIENASGGTFQLGSDALPADRLEYGIANMTVSGTVINLAAISIGTLDSSRSALAKVDAAIDRTSRERGSLGAVINRLQYTLNFTSNTLQNITNSESTVRDADYSILASDLSRNQILRDTNLAAMTQARLVPQNLMSLLS